MKVFWNKREDIISYIQEKRYNFRCRVFVRHLFNIFSVRSRRDKWRIIWKGFTSKYKKGLLKLYAQHAQSPMKGAYME